MEHPSPGRLVATLGNSLKEPASSQTREQRLQEEQWLEDFTQAYAQRYDFSSPESGLTFDTLFNNLLEFRLLNKAWLQAASSDQKLRVLQCARLLTRDPKLQAHFVNQGGVVVLAQLFEEFAKDHYADEQPPFHAEIVIECASILKKLVREEKCRAQLAETKVEVTLVQLLRTHDSSLLPSVLMALTLLAQSSTEYRNAIADLGCLEALLMITSDYGKPLRNMACDLMAVIFKKDQVKNEFMALDGYTKIISLLHTDDVPFLQSLMRVLSHIALLPEAANELRNAGGLPVLISLLSPQNTASYSSASVLCGVCSVLTKLAMNDESAFHIRKCNGIYLLGKLLLVKEERFPGSCLQVKTHAFRTLRFLFSMERNRKMFKRIFPPFLFAAFIDIGHYVQELKPYESLVQHLQDLPPRSLSDIEHALEDINAVKTGQEKVINGYTIQELLGKGAFGSVYQVKKEAGETLYAMKELPLEDMQLFGLTSEEKEKSIGNLNHEVEILSKLEHPHVIRYYESFVEGHNLYIVMELVEGVSLLDYITSLSEKRQRMPEKLVWTIFIQIMLALNYIHNEKKIVHRDLTPSNIMLQHNHRRVKIADFGLAKQKTGASVMMSVVGTMPYSCPEIIQHEQYTDKADVWTVGCVLYHMIALEPPFQGSNPLTVASKIVEGEYPSMDSLPYSADLKNLIKVLLTTDPNKRPNIKEVSAIVSTVMAHELDRLSGENESLHRELAFERDRRNKEASIAYKCQEAYRRVLIKKEEMGSPNYSPKMGPRPGPAPKISINQNRLRPVADPVGQILHLLHKVMFIDQLPPGLERDPKQRTVERFKRYLFSPKMNAGSIKGELVKVCFSGPLHTHSERCQLQHVKLTGVRLDKSPWHIPHEMWYVHRIYTM
eukprot:jgi/Mesvir1/16115/Mv08400-RA.2